MSSVSPSPTSAAPVGSSGQPDPNGPSNTNPLISSQVALYLYTFLVTLVVLFALSAAIIARSCVLRRRHRQRMEEAVRRGTYVPSIPQKWKLGTKPAVHDVHLGRREEKNDTSLWSWHEIMPVAATLTCSSTLAANPSTPHSLTPPSSTSVNIIDWIRPHLLRQDKHQSSATSTDGLDDMLESKHAPLPTALVTVLVAMPTLPEMREKLARRHETRYSSEKDDKVPELPHLEFGIAEVGMGGNLMM